jgi:heme-degrading monooxygenase HmoA
MHVTWTTFQLDTPTPICPWVPVGARFTQAGYSGAGPFPVSSFDGRWWSVLAVWDDERIARSSGPAPGDVAGSAWHVVLEPVSYHGDASLSGGARPFDGLPRTGKTEGASVVITLAGLGGAGPKAAEVFKRFLSLGRDVAQAPGYRAGIIQSPPSGALLTFTAWETLRDAVTWAYHRPEHTAAVRRQQEHKLLETTGFLRCAVRSSSGTLGLMADPLAGLTGAAKPTPLSGLSR